MAKLFLYLTNINAIDRRMTQDLSSLNIDGKFTFLFLLPDRLIPLRAESATIFFLFLKKCAT